jgi:phage gp36-like protein
MAYSTDADLLAELGQFGLARLSGDDTGVTVNTVRVSKAREMAESIIDANLTGRYDLPLDSPSGLLESISIDLTIYYLSEYRYRDSIVPPGAIRRRDIAMDLLDKIAKGLLVLPGHISGDNAPSIIRSNINKKESYFDDDSMDDFFSR